MINFYIMLMLAFHMGQACSSLMVFMSVLKRILVCVHSLP